MKTVNYTSLMLNFPKQKEPASVKSPKDRLTQNLNG